MPGPTKIDICAGGIVNCSGSSRGSITLTNDHGKDCYIPDLNLPNPNPKGPYNVPAHSGLTIEFDCKKGDYTYHPDCCGKGIQTPPVIIVQ